MNDKRQQINTTNQIIDKLQAWTGESEIFSLTRKQLTDILSYYINGIYESTLAKRYGLDELFSVIDILCKNNETLPTQPQPIIWVLKEMGANHIERLSANTIHFWFRTHFYTLTILDGGKYQLEMIANTFQTFGNLFQMMAFLYSI